MRPPAAERDQARRQALEAQHADAIAEAETVAAQLAKVLASPAAALAAAAVNKALVAACVGFGLWRRPGPKR